MIYSQKIGNTKNNVVSVVRYEGDYVYLKSKTYGGFIYKTLIKNFEKFYVQIKKKPVVQ